MPVGMGGVSPVFLPSATLAPKPSWFSGKSGGLCSFGCRGAHPRLLGGHTGLWKSASDHGWGESLDTHRQGEVSALGRSCPVLQCPARQWAGPEQWGDESPAPANSSSLFTGTCAWEGSWHPTLPLCVISAPQQSWAALVATRFLLGPKQASQPLPAESRGGRPPSSPLAALPALCAEGRAECRERKPGREGCRAAGRVGLKLHLHC